MKNAMTAAGVALGLAIALVAAAAVRGTADPSASDGAAAAADRDSVARPAGTPRAKTLSFSGYEWKVKSSPGRVGPGSNYFSDETENVAVDSQGRLHLKITRRGDRWYCAEVISKESLGYGTYRWYLDTPAENLDPDVVLGLFTWSDEPAFHHREIDIELSRWGQAENKNGQFVIQPYTRPRNIVRFPVPPGLDATTHSFVWRKDRVDCLSVRGHAAAPGDDASVIQLWSSTEDVPQAAGENARMNLWLMRRRGPADGKEVEVIVSKFEFIPLR